MLTNDDLQQIGKLIEPIKKDLQDVKQSQAQTNGRLGKLEDGQTHLKTAIEALKAGQDDIRENMATKGDIHRLEQKIDKVAKDVKGHTNRIENLEEHTGTPNPHKN